MYIISYAIKIYCVYYVFQIIEVFYSHDFTFVTWACLLDVRSVIKNTGAKL